MTDAPRTPVALITGASSGIGAALAIELAAAGHTVVLSARGVDRLEATAAVIRGRGGRALVLPCDVADRGAVTDVVARSLAETGRLDVVVANAGVYSRKAATQLGRADFESAFAVNFFGAVHLIEAALPHLQRQRSGHLVLMTSFDAKKAMPHDGSYAAAKAALATFGATLRQDLRGSGVHVCTVFPGRVDTPMIDDLDVPAISAKIRPERVARAVLRALRRRRAEVVVPWHCGLLAWADMVSPRLADWFVRVLHLDGRPRSP